MTIPFLDLKAATTEVRTELDAAHRRVADSGWFLIGRSLKPSKRSMRPPSECLIASASPTASKPCSSSSWPTASVKATKSSCRQTATSRAWLAVTHVGATPIPCEPDSRTYNLDPNRLAALVSARTKAILPIHLYGQTADMTAINTVAARHGLFVLEDGPQSHGARAKGRSKWCLGARRRHQLLPDEEPRCLGRRRCHHDRRRRARPTGPLTSQLWLARALSPRRSRPQLPPG